CSPLLPHLPKPFPAPPPAGPGAPNPQPPANANRREQSAWSRSAPCEDRPPVSSSAAFPAGPRFQRRQPLVKNSHRSGPVVQRIQIKLLIRRMDPIIGQPESDQQRFNAQFIVQQAHHRNASPLA